MCQMPYELGHCAQKDENSEYAYCACGALWIVENGQYKSCNELAVRKCEEVA
ncbi:hypothetical protein M0R72_19875 [Candidatus Pacearchaeota archaeon]|jgi:hypothetical protein|nr:hypothetical protein [Candidatus Pacearchaeota archaeon]